MTIHGSIIDWTEFNESKANCFIKHGEEFIVLPHLLQSTFRSYSSEQIEKACDKLNIKLLLCDSKELSVLKSRGILPKDCIRQVGLIRRSDAERLYKLITLSIDSTLNNFQHLHDSSYPYIPVQHYCFGSQNGKLFPHLYKDVYAQCIICNTCESLFSPSSFVGHSHSLEEIHKVVHWGFDSSNWRLYICIDEHRQDYLCEYNQSETAQMLENVKKKFFYKEVAVEKCPHRMEKLNSWKFDDHSYSFSTLPEPPAIIMKSQEVPWPEHIERGKPVELSEDSVPVGLNPDPHDIENYRDRVPNIALKSVKIKSIKEASQNLLHFLSQSNTADVNLSPRANYLKSFQQRVVRRTVTEDVSYTQRVCTNAQLALVKAIFAIGENTSQTTSSQLLRLFEDVKRSHQLVVTSIQQETHMLKKRLAQHNVEMEHVKIGTSTSNPSPNSGECSKSQETLDKSETAISKPDNESLNKNVALLTMKRKAPGHHSTCSSQSTVDGNSRYPVSWQSSSNKKRVWITSYEGESDGGQESTRTESQPSNVNVPNVL